MFHHNGTPVVRKRSEPIPRPRTLAGPRPWSNLHLMISRGRRPLLVGRIQAVTSRGRIPRANRKRNQHSGTHTQGGRCSTARTARSTDSQQSPRSWGFWEAAVHHTRAAQIPLLYPPRAAGRPPHERADPIEATPRSPSAARPNQVRHVWHSRRRGHWGALTQLEPTLTTWRRRLQGPHPWSPRRRTPRPRIIFRR